MMGKMCSAHKAAWVLLLIGGFNWLLVGILQRDLFEILGLGMGSWVARIVYILVGAATIMMLSIGKCCMKDGMCKCDANDCSHCVAKPSNPAAPKM